MIKQIQLRGISRTPSDRLSEDGGLSESLNMYLDTAENAPALVPEDVTTELGLPADLQAERIFIHKTANYENYIVVQGNRVVAYTPGIEDEEPVLILELGEGEKVNDITSVGNTLIVATNYTLAYILYKNNRYSYLGNNIPRPAIEFRTISNENFDKGHVETIIQHATYYNAISGLDVSAWDQAIEDIKVNKVTENTLQLESLNQSIWEKIQTRINELEKERIFCAPFFVRYAVKLYDQSYFHVSEPILIGAGYDTLFDINFERIRTTNNGISTYYTWNLNNLISSKAYLLQWNTEGWEDIISSVDIFFSTPIYFPNMHAKFSKLVMTSGGGTSDLVNNDYFDVYFAMTDTDEMSSIESEILSKSVFFKVDSFTLSRLDVIKEGYDLAENYKNLSDDILAEQDTLSESAFSKQFIASQLFNYNNRVVANVISQTYEENFPVLPSTNIALRSGTRTTRNALFFAFHLEDGTKIIARDYHGYKDFYGYSMIIPGDQGDEEHIAGMYGLIFYPEQTCSRVEILDEDGEVYSVKMKMHPFLPYSYAFWGLSKTIFDLPSQEVDIDDFLEEQEKKLTEIAKLMVSESSNPFVFPISGQFTFQSKVIGIAVTTTALSQGQFGQFPLYVFTEDGIWAMETTADGSFISQKPLSREVCINSDSICSIDNAVVFVTAKAVMMIQGSQVMNISPYMNGRHYMPNASALSILEKQEGFGDLIVPISDSDPFMKFMQDAKVAYDYTGQRLIFISRKEDGTPYGFQYVYKIDTQTWHKVSFSGFDLDTPLNSYPEAYIAGNKQGDFPYVVISEPIDPPSQNLVKLINSTLGFYGLKNSVLGEPYLIGESGIPVGHLSAEDLQQLRNDLRVHTQVENDVIVAHEKITRVYSLSTVLDASRNQDTANGILITRPFDLGMPDVYKSITSIKIRGDYDKGNIKYILQGSDDGRNFYTLNSLRGKSWKMFRIFILADLEPTERISWIDVDFEPRYNNKLR